MFLVNILVLIISKYLFFGHLLKKFKDHDDEFLTASDFTINIKIKDPRSFKNEEELDFAINKAINNNKPENEPEIKFVKKNLIFETKEYLEKLVQKLSLTKIIRCATEKNKPDLEKLVSELKVIQTDLDRLKNKYFDEPFYNFTGWCFITFDTQKEAQTVIKRNKLAKFRLYGKAFNYQRAPEPNDIFWANWSITPIQRLKKTVLGNFLSFLTIVVNFGIILGIEYGQTQVKKTVKNSTAVFFVNLLISVVTVVINIILSLLLQYFAAIECHQTIGDYYSAIVSKITYSNFINTALIVLITNRIATGQQDWNIFGFSGVMGTIMIMMILHSVSDSLLCFFDPLYIFKLMKQQRLTATIKGGKEIVLQSEANEAFEASPSEMYIFYNYCFKTICISFFYQAILPYGLLLGIIELTLKFLVFKYVLINRLKKPIEHELNFSIEMVILFEFLIFVLGLGFVVFSVIFSGWQVLGKPIMIVIIIICVLEWVGGIRALGHLWDYQSSNRSVSTVEAEPCYVDVKDDFIFDYDLMNPLTVINKLKERMQGDMQGRNATLGGDDFEEALHYYAAHLQNQFGGKKLYHDEIPNQKLLEEFSAQNDRKSFTVSQNLKVNPYHLIDANYYQHMQEKFIDKSEETEQVLGAIKSRNIGGTTLPGMPKKKRKHHYQDIVQDVIGSMREHERNSARNLETQGDHNVTVMDVKVESGKSNKLD